MKSLAASCPTDRWPRSLSDSALAIRRTDRYEEFSIEPSDLRALVTVINEELERCTEPVDAAIR